MLRNLDKGSRPSLNKPPIYAALGMPEVQRYTYKRLTLYQLLQDGYTPTEVSEVLPGIRRQDLMHFLDTARTMTHRTTWFKAVVASIQTLDQG